MSKRNWVFLFLALVLAGFTSAALAQGINQATTILPEPEHAFEYQGQLLSDVIDTTGLFDFEFSLYDTAEDGQQIGQTVNVDKLELDQGQFVVSLDFGALGSGYQYLEVGVRPSGSGEPFTILKPRQPLSAEEETAPDAQESVTGVITHTHSVNPGAFLYDEDSTDITMNIYYGLRWAANPNERGGFYMSRPPDWDGQTPVQVRITFATGSGDAGTVNWRLRLNSYVPNSGEWLTNPASRDADDILVFTSGSSLRIFDQTFTLQPQDFNDEPYWSMFFTRGDGTNGETFSSNLYVMGVEVIYLADR